MKMETENKPEVKVNKTGKIVAFIIGGLFLLLGIFGFIFYSIINGIQNGPEATAIKTVLEGLDNGDRELVREYSSQAVYDDFYAQNEYGVTMANIFKNSNIRVTIKSISRVNKGANVFFKISADNNSDIVSQFNYAQLQEFGGNWIVTYMGIEEEEVNINTDTDFVY